MKVQNTESLTQKILKEFKNEQDLDFRTHKYLTNNHNLTPVFCYDFAEKIVMQINSFLIKKFGSQVVIYNLKNDCDSLRNNTLKSYLESRIFEYASKMHFSFSHYFARAFLNSNSVAVYKNDDQVRLVHEYYQEEKSVVILTKKEWSKAVAKTDEMNNLSSLAFILDRYFNTEFFKD